MRNPLKGALLAGAMLWAPIAAQAAGVSIAQTVVAVSSTTDTTIVGHNRGRITLGIYVQTTGAACTVTFDQTATANNGLILGSGSPVGYGFTWDNPDSTPLNSVHVYCTTAASVVVWEGY